MGGNVNETSSAATAVTGMWTTFIWLLVIGTSIWVGFDAHQLGVKRGILGGGFTDMGVAGWTIGVFGLWIIGFPAYMATRPRYVALARAGSRTTPNSDQGSVAAGWYPDPMQRHELRYWDGMKWSEHVSNAGIAAREHL
jgi:hypothetical protein